MLQLYAGKFGVWVNLLYIPDQPVEPALIGRGTVNDKSLDSDNRKIHHWDGIAINNFCPGYNNIGRLRESRKNQADKSKQYDNQAFHAQVDFSFNPAYDYKYSAGYYNATSYQMFCHKFPGRGSS